MTQIQNKHEIIDQRSIALHALVSKKLRENPLLLELARKNIEGYLTNTNNSAPYYLKWKMLLDGPFEKLLAVILLDSQEMRAMRQCSPFAGILTPQERWAVYAKFRIHEKSCKV